MTDESIHPFLSWVEGVPEIGDVLSRFEARRYAGIASAGSAPNTNETMFPAPPLADQPLLILERPVQRSPVIVRFDIEQEYEGTVTAVDESSGTFTARLIDVSHESADEEAEFSLREITDDRHLVVPGAIFSWVIGLQWRRRQSTRVSEIRFRRLPPFDQDSITRAESSMNDLANLLSTQNDLPTRDS